MDIVRVPEGQLTAIHQATGVDSMVGIEGMDCLGRRLTATAQPVPSPSQHTNKATLSKGPSYLPHKRGNRSNVGHSVILSVQPGAGKRDKTSATKTEGERTRSAVPAEAPR